MLHHTGLYTLLILICCELLCTSLVSQHHPNDVQISKEEIYSFDGEFDSTNRVVPFEGNLINSATIIEDTDRTLSISSVIKNHKNIEWQDLHSVTLELNKVYWVHAKLEGNSSFTGDQYLYLNPTDVISFLPKSSIYDFDYLDIHAVHSDGRVDKFSIGNKLDLAHQKIQFWGELLKINVTPSDKIDLYLRLDGLNPYYPIPDFRLWHVNYESVQQERIFRGILNSLFYGVLIIQFVFFLCLYFIEKEKMHLYFSIFVFGILLSRVFIGNNFLDFVAIPFWFKFHNPLFILGLYLAVIGTLLFTKKYLSYDQTILSKKIFPIFIGISTIIHASIIIIQTMNWGMQYGGLHMNAIDSCTLIALLIILWMIYHGKNATLKEKQFYMIAWLPIILVTFYWIYDHNLAVERNQFSLIEGYFKLALIFMTTALALMIGFRTKNLKEDNNKALKQNLENQQIIIENKLRAEKLEEVNNLKTRFYTNITHEFRTPLTVIIGNNQEMILESKQLPLEEKIKHKFSRRLELINRNSQNLLTLVNQLLDLSKADSGALKLDLKQSDIISYFNYLIESFYSAAEEKNIRLVFYSEVDSLVMDYDENKIQQLTYNLLSNAIKFTDQGGKIVFHVVHKHTDSQSDLVIKVTDSGIGIEEDKIPYLFDRFYQVDDSGTRMGSGTGIGLSLSKELVELMGGTITVESKVSKGSTFTILIPVTQLAVVRLEQTKSIKEITPSIVLKKQNHLLTERNSPANLVKDNEDNKLRILIIEDNPDVAEYTADCLSPSYNILIAENGQRGINLAFEHIPELIITDVMMPLKDGFEVCEILKEDIRTSHIPIIMLTAKAGMHSKLEGLGKGADAFVVKPFVKKELEIRTSSLLQLRQKLQSHYLTLASDHKAKPHRHQILENEPEEHKFVTELKKIIEDNLVDYNYSVDKLSTAIGMSSSNLYRKVKALTGISPNKFINHLRLNKAKEILNDSNQNISDVAYAVGFNDPGYFARQFKKEFGISPLEWRKSHNSDVNDS